MEFLKRKNSRNVQEKYCEKLENFQVGLTWRFLKKKNIILKDFFLSLIYSFHQSKCLCRFYSLKVTLQGWQIFFTLQERVCSLKDRLGRGVIYRNNFDIFSFKTVLLPVSRNLQCQAFWPVIFMWYFGPKLRPILKGKV